MLTQVHNHPAINILAIEAFRLDLVKDLPSEFLHLWDEFLSHLGVVEGIEVLQLILGVSWAN